MGRRRKRRKIIRPSRRRRPPKVFPCPHCGVTMLTIKIDNKNGIAKAYCGHCGFKAEFSVPKGFEAVDAYGRLLDLYAEGSLEYEIVKEEESFDVEGESREVSME